MAFVYILLSREYKKTYVGSTTDLARRFTEHNNGNSYYTKKYIPWELFYKEEFLMLSEARKRERYLKSCAGRKFIKNLFK